MQSTIQNTQLSRRVGDNAKNIPIDQLAEKLPNSNIWRAKDIDAFVKKSVRNSVLCSQTTAATNIYISNPDDSHVQYLGEKVLHQYIYADEYLEKLQASISTAIAMNRAIIHTKREKLETLIDLRSDTGRMARLENWEKTLEMEVLKRIVRLPEVLVELIKEYIPTTIMVAVFRIPQEIMQDHLAPLKLKNLKGIYCYMKKLPESALRMQLWELAHHEIIRASDYSALWFRRYKSSSKKDIISAIHEACYCYNLILNVVANAVAKVSKERHKTPLMILCEGVRKALAAELVYIYKLMNFAARPCFNGRTRKPRVSSNVA
jgi:hypothetical protein